MMPSANNNSRSRSVSEVDMLIPSGLSQNGVAGDVAMKDIEIIRFSPEKQHNGKRMLSIPDVEVGIPKETRRGLAIRVRDATKSFGDSRVLKGLNMNVQKGSIYSLLGSSGCGKTTLLSCIIGIKHLDAGEVLVFGAKTGTKESGVPGKCVGYMPQDIALYGQFSIKETLHYFGSLNAMSESDIVLETGALIDFLDLPDGNRKVCQLSGGQKRRLSLAVSLVHSPELIILDEPTVGVDPLLRESIWNHLRELVESNGVTVIITTHYIDEARDSDRVGVMRDGKLLSEKSPADLYESFGTTVLEQIVLKLCHDDENQGKKNKTVGRYNSKPQALVDCASSNSDVEELEYRALSPGGRKWSMTVPELRSSFCSDFVRSLKRIRAMTVKNMSLLLRNYLFALFLIMSPTIIMVCMYYTVGGVLKPLNMGVINQELNSTDECETHKPGGCDLEGFSCQYLNMLPGEIIKLFPFKTEAEAELEVRSGKLHGFMTFPKKYSESVYLRVSSDTSADSKTLSDSVIHFRLDESVLLLAQQLKTIFTSTYKYFVQGLLKECGFNPALGNLPLEFGKPVFGGADDQFREYSGLTFLVGILFFFPMCSSSISYVWDNKQGTLERARVAGVRTWEILAASLMTEFSVLLIQSTMGYGFYLYIFGTEVLGSHCLAFAIIIALGVTGVANGFLFSSFCEEEIQAVLLCLLSYFPSFFLSGIMWPPEGMSKVVQYFSYYSPITLPMKAMCCIVFRGMGIENDEVWPGFVASAAWITGLCIVTVLIHRFSLARK